jgi:transcriptional regulator with XRE-family HTH domain
MNTKRYDTVEAMVLDTLGTDGVDAMNQHSEAVKFIRGLVSFRNEKKITQRQLAKTMACSPSKVCRIEAGRDADLTLGDIETYACALGLSVHLALDDESLPAAARIKHHVFLIKDLLDSLAEIATKQNDDPGLVNKIHQFYGEVLFNFSMRFGDSYHKLPPAITVGTKPAIATALSKRATECLVVGT